MSRSEERAAIRFRVLCIAFSALLMILALFARIRLVTVQTEIRGLEDSIRSAENTGVQLRIKKESRLSLAELERFALQELGMQHPEPGQITVIESAG